MANTNVATAAGRPAESGSSASRRTSCARRRSLLAVVFVLMVLGAAVLANYGPLRAYYEAQARVDQATAAVAELESQRATLQSNLGRLTEAGYLETLARQQLTYARPGEEVYIVTGTPAAEEGVAAEGVAAEDSAAEGVAAEGPAAQDETTEAADRRGPLERLLNALGALF